MIDVILKLLQSGVHRRLHRLKVTALLTAAGAVFMLVAAGFGLALLSVWLQQLYGTEIAFAIGGGCAAVALVLFAVAFWHPHRERPAAAHETAMPELAATKRSFEEALAAVQGGSREAMLVALALAVATGVTLGRRH
jgi:hypothetical protein